MSDTLTVPFLVETEDGTILTVTSAHDAQGRETKIRDEAVRFVCQDSTGKWFSLFLGNGRGLLKVDKQ